MKPTSSSRNRSLLTRFVTSYSSILLFVLVLGFFFMFSLSNTYRNSTYRQNTTLFENSVKEMDTSLRLFSTLTTQIASNETIRSLSYLHPEDKTYNFYALGKESMEYLANLMSVQGMLPINSFYVYLPETNYFISPSQFASKEMFYFTRIALAQELSDKRDALISSYDNVMTLLPFSDYTGTKDTTYLYKIPLSATFSENYHPGIACFEINISYLRSYFEPVLTSDASLLYVIDKSGNEVFFSGNLSGFSTIVDSLLIMADATVSDSHHEEFRHNSQRYTITKTISSYNGWTYYLIQPSAYLLNDLSSYQATYLIAIAIVLILSFLMILSLSRANMKPFEVMHSKLESSHKENTILQEKNGILQDTLTKQQPLVFSASLARIMKGSVSGESDEKELNDILQIGGLGQKHFHVLLISLRLEQPEDINRYQLQEYESLLFRCFYHYFGDEILIYHPDVNSFALLLSSDKETKDAGCIESIREIFTNLHDYLLTEHSLWTYAGLGDSNTKLPYFWKSYHQAMEASSILKDDVYFQSYYELTRSNETYYYPYEMAQQLTTFIKDANTVQINEIFKLIFRENVTYRSISDTNLKYLLSDLRTTLVKIRQGIAEDASDASALAEFDTAFAKEVTIEGMQNLALKLASCIKQNTSGNRLITAIQNYISKNYSDADLSLKKISEVFSISESYFSYLFKSETGRNFSESLEELRMQQAMHLLKETDIPLSELYAHLGYSNANSFRRAFKKVYGASPKEFRQSSNDTD